MMRHVVQGRGLSAKVHPLIFRNTPPDTSSPVNLRTLSFLTALVADAVEGGSQYRMLTHHQKRSVAVGVRDLYIAESHHLLDENEKHTLAQMLHIVDESLDTLQTGGMTVSFYPSKNFTIMKFIQDLDNIMAATQLELYAQYMDTPKLFAVFVNAADLKALTQALKASNVLRKLAGGRLSSSFEFVNYVFRCNRFEPQDSNFHCHLDTPYYDNARSHVSKYTLLIYLTGGQNESVLRVKDVSLDEVDKMTCVIFDQRCEHEGRPFLTGTKTFVRTELVFKDEKLSRNDQAAALFSEACYMTGQSMFDKDMTSYSHECFERANSLRWAVEKSASQPPVYLSKEFQDIQFLTNGYNYWFPRGSGFDAKACTLVAVLDYFNCKVGQQPFQSLSSATKIQERIYSTQEIWSLLLRDQAKKPRGFKRLQESDVDSLIKTGPHKPFLWHFEDWDGEPEEIEHFEKDGDGCCPMHSFPMFNPWKNEDVMKAYDLCCDYTRKRLLRAPLLLFDQEIIINEDSIQVVGDKIFILRDQNCHPIRPVNFAACWCDEPAPPDFIVVGEEIVSPDLLVPPITLHESPEGYTLGLDFFRNDWMLKVDEEHSIPVPDLSERPDDETPFVIRIPESAEGMERVFNYWE
ncbi:hypothetical protein AK830_g4446 [Neonectria ditissima]|uniref:Prolyl 4-hydroxylase alpha subunit domain-containing protein n=1 Tax=Neonectria ditissima TaxID=78410 RepID=A0A0N8H7L5_9HYPO|nr:hypothetical protein AK830_g4446 [Neonectria ditissima]